ncbi:hypothetical protein NDN08_006361 [Rhodosorus marinus]|uniref:Peptidase S1 domain-containing protein n=1 Tax=Rhodosorus marinus TaxID=101924 RepID=A0AAV8UNK6_9RHOD|nr:hypothetical protein NDN08_006361 [Rhodosorus marinus]
MGRKGHTMTFLSLFCGVLSVFSLLFDVSLGVPVEFSGVQSFESLNGLGIRHLGLFTGGGASFRVENLSRQASEQPDLSTFLFNGEEVRDDDEFPNVLALIAEHEDGALYIFCSASLIAPRVVLTAAHCVYSIPSSVKLHACGGTSNLRKNMGTCSEVSDIYIPDGYVEGQAFEGHDVGILALAEELPNIPPLKISFSKPPSGIDSIAIGFGRYETNQPHLDGTLNYAPSVVVTTENCNFLELNGFNGDEDLICSYPNFNNSGATICHGDSGGPLMVRGGSVEDSYLIGVASYGYGAQDCDPAYEQVYMSIYSETHSSFIRNTVAVIGAELIVGDPDTAEATETPASTPSVLPSCPPTTMVPTPTAAPSEQGTPSESPAPPTPPVTGSEEPTASEMPTVTSSELPSATPTSSGTALPTSSLAPTDAVPSELNTPTQTLDQSATPTQSVIETPTPTTDPDASSTPTQTLDELQKCALKLNECDLEQDFNCMDEDEPTADCCTLVSAVLDCIREVEAECSLYGLQPEDELQQKVSNKCVKGTEPPQSPQPGAPGLVNACFPADAKVNLADGTIKEMRELEAGDRVLVVDGSFSDVYAFSHRDPVVVSEFIRIESSDGHVIELSPTHYLVTGDELRAAKDVAKGDQMELANGGSSRVVRISRVKKSGLYNPHTLQGTIVVNNVVASTYTQSVHPLIAEYLLSIPRLLYRFGFKEPLGSLLYKTAPEPIFALLGSRSS